MKVLIAIKNPETEFYILDYYYKYWSNPGNKVVLAKIFIQPNFSMEEFYPGPLIISEKYLVSVSEKLKKEKERLKIFKNRTIEKFGGDVDDKLLDPRSNSIGMAIVVYAEQIKADMIIMGACTKSNITSVIMGSTTKEVVHSTKIPITICPFQKPPVQII